MEKLDLCEYEIKKYFPADAKKVNEIKFQKTNGFNDKV